jgi:hypothetical protein
VGVYRVDGTFIPGWNRVKFRLRDKEISSGIYYFIVGAKNQAGSSEGKIGKVVILK